MIIFFLAALVACVAWTVTKEEVFREFREWCQARASHHNFFVQKFCYMMQCEYCFSHYVTALVLIITGHKAGYNDIRGSMVAGFAIVWIANFYMTFYFIARQTLKLVGTLAKEMER